MATDPTTRLRRAVEARKRAAEEERAAILEALRPDSGVKQAEVARITGYSREHLRKMARDHGIESRRTTP